MPSYEGKSYYQNKDVARQYDAQFTGSLTLANLRAKLYGLREEAVFLRLLNNVPEGGTVLDVPAGTGRYVDHLLSRGFVVGGVDVSPQMLEIARQRIGNNPNLLFLKVADAVELPFREREFSGVTCMRLPSYSARDTQKDVSGGSPGQPGLGNSLFRMDQWVAGAAALHPLTIFARPSQQPSPGYYESTA